jgi:ABC-type branched-subunit amino acid transport system substrate-binding protein
MAKGAGQNIKGIVGSQNWDWKLEDAGTKAFVQSFGTKYGFPPSQAAQTCYAQTLLYADAVNRAGSFNPCAVGEALVGGDSSLPGISSDANKGFVFDGLGNGETLYRAADHQCFKDVLVVKGADDPQDEFHLVEIVEVTPVAQVWYEPDNPMFAGGELGACNPGA